MSDNSFEYITTDYMVSVNPIEDTQSPTVEYIVELGQQGLPGAKGEPGEPGFSPVVTSVIDDNTIRFTLVNKDEVSTTPNFYDLLAKKDLSNTTYADDMANKLDKDGTNADSPITLNKLIITRGTTTTADVYLTTTNNRNININAPIRTTNNIQLSPSGTSGTVTYKGYELATLNDIPEVPDVSNFLNKDGSNVASTISLQDVSLTGNIQTVQPNFYISNNKASNGNITVSTYDGDIYLSPDSSHKLYYRNREIATLSDIPTVGNGLITIKQGDTIKGTFTTNQSGNATINLDAGSSGSGAVDSVNGKTGVVVLTASDVGALPDSTIIPTVNNATITFTQGGTTKGTITLNQSSNQTIALDAGGGGGVTNPITLSETIEGNTYSLSIGIDKTTGNLQGTYSHPVSGGTNTAPLFSRSYGLINAGLSNNWTTVNGYQENQLSVKVDNSTIGFNSNGALTVTGSYASTSDLDDKVSKSGDTMTGTLTLEQAEFHSVWTDTDSTVTPSSQISHDAITFRDVNNVGMTYMGFKRNTDGSYLSNLTTRKKDGTSWASFNIGFDANGNSYCTFPNTKCVDSRVYDTTKTLLENGNLSVAEHNYSLSSYLPKDGNVYEIFLEIRGRTGTASGNYALIYANGGTTGCNLVYTTTRSSSFTTFCGYGSVYVSSARSLTIKLTGNATTNTVIIIRGYRRIGTNN